jgi:sodium--glutamate symport carrier gltS
MMRIRLLPCRHAHAHGVLRYGASNKAFIVVPIMCAFFVDLANALIIPFFASYF